MTSDPPGEPALQTMRLARGIDLAFRAAGDRARPALLLLHGFPSSSRTFRQVIGPLSRLAYVVAPDLPGFGASDVLDRPSFSAFSDCVEELLERLEVGQRFIYLHDFGAPVGLRLAMRAPDRVRGLVIQNANAHRSGLGPQWADTMEFWSAPDARNEAAATAHLTPDGIRDQYVGGLPAELAPRIDPRVWAEDWRVMGLPGRMETQRALIADYASHVARFDEIASYLAAHQPPALLLWGRHDPFFDLAEVSSWLASLPRMEAHIFDAGHFLLETHADQSIRLMGEFLAPRLTPRP
jgi:pimeloyl-ACP methyl ester carboxylesterase